LPKRRKKTMIRNIDDKDVILNPDEDAVFQEFTRLKASSITPLIKSLKNCNMSPERITRAFVGLEEKKMIYCISDPGLYPLTDEQREMVIKQIAAEFEEMI
jgi:hypothetical protein